MELTALLLSRLQLAFTVSAHIIFPSFTIGLAAWLTVLEALHLRTGRPVYRTLFEFWLKVLGVAFGLGVVSGIVMAFQFVTNWSVPARTSGPIQGLLLTYGTFTAFALEAGFLGVLLFGRSRRARPWFYLFSTAMVALGTTLPAFWIMADNSWMQVPVGYAVENGMFTPTDWAAIIFSPVSWVRFPHMLLARGAGLFVFPLMLAYTAAACACSGARSRRRTRTAEVMGMISTRQLGDRRRHAKIMSLGRGLHELP